MLKLHFISSRASLLSMSILLTMMGTLICSNSMIHSATPSIPNIFTGRNDLVSEGVEIICRDGQNHLAILGPGGIGKTSLAMVISNSQKVKKRFQKQHFLPCDILEDHNALTQGFIQVLGLQMHEGKSQHDVFYRFLHANQEPILFILDNFETPWNFNERDIVRQFIQKIAWFPCVTLLLTMRGLEGPGDITWHKLGRDSQVPSLSPKAAREAFYLISQRDRDDDSKKVDHLMAELDCVPLAINLIAQLAKKFKVEVVDLIEMWDKEKTKILSEPGAQPGKLTSVEHSIELSMGMLHLDAKALLSVIAFLPNGVPNWNKSLKEMLSDFKSPGVQMRAFELLGCSLILQTNGALMMLAPVREYIQLKYEPPQSLLRQIEVFYVQMTEGFSNNSEEERMDLDIHALNLFKTFTHYKGIGGPGETAHCLKSLGSIYFNQSIYSNATKFLSEAKSQFGVIGNQREAAHCLRILGEIHREQANYSEAAKMLTKAQTHFQSIGDQWGDTRCLQELGDIHRMQDNYSEAIRMLTDAKAQFHGIGDKQGATQCMQSLGFIQIMQNNYSEATKTLKEASIQFQNMGAQLEAAQCMQSLGDIHRMQGNYNEAIKMLTEARAQFWIIGNQLGAAECLQWLGQTHGEQGNFTDAAQKLTEARIQFESIGHQPGASLCLMDMTLTLRKQNKFNEALPLLSQLKEVFSTFGDQRSIAWCLSEFGVIYRELGDYDLAKQSFIDALALYSQLECQDYEKGWCFYGFGLLLQYTRDFVGAREKFKEARDLFAPLESCEGDVEMCDEALQERTEIENDTSSK
jgi:tetratricopeptide (TPR) repeat protein